MSADANVISAASRPHKLWKTALFLVGSGLLGGVAIALWNRRELSEIQSRRDDPVVDESPEEREEAIY